MITPQNWADAQTLWDFQLLHHPLRQCSVAIGLGSHDLGVADVTASLFHRGLFPVIVFTGATSRTTEERMPRGEAEHYRERALELGVPASAILVEDQARNTGDNIRLSRRLLEEHGIDVRSALIISKPYEERRAYATALKLWPEVEFISASSPLSLDEYVATIGDENLVIDMLVGAQQRVQIYPELGFMVDQAVPQEVTEAFDRLVKAGFTSRIMEEK
ncbi:YdcF family protein [Streptomyces sp. NPDC000961]|uniref:YdcF family protein n=1 Tax=Streptomyces sp. NPDC000961 TaxID=3364541 RepID=UPI0036C497A3